jgi:hypothetical protein
MSKATRSLAQPFRIGQTADDAAYVLRRTNRRRNAVYFETRKGEEFHLPLKRDSEPAIRRSLRDAEIKPAEVTRVRWFFDDFSLTFEKGRGPGGRGSLCFRIVAVEVMTP